MGAFNDAQAQLLREAITQAIKDKKTNYKEVSLKAGLGETAVRDIIKGRAKNPRIDTLQKILAVLDLNVSDFVDTPTDEHMKMYAQLKESDKSKVDFMIKSYYTQHNKDKK